MQAGCVGSGFTGICLSMCLLAKGSARCAQIQEVKGMRCWVGGSISSYPQGVVLCTCTAQLVDLQQLWAAKR